MTIDVYFKNGDTLHHFIDGNLVRSFNYDHEREHDAYMWDEETITSYVLKHSGEYRHYRNGIKIRQWKR